MSVNSAIILKDKARVIDQHSDPCEFEVEFPDSPSRIDLGHLTVVIDRPERPTLLKETGGGANHLT